MYYCIRFNRANPNPNRKSQNQRNRIKIRFIRTFLSFRLHIEFRCHIEFVKIIENSIISTLNYQKTHELTDFHFMNFRFSVNESSEQLIQSDEEATDNDYDPYVHREVEHPLT